MQLFDVSSFGWCNIDQYDIDWCKIVKMYRLVHNLSMNGEILVSMSFTGVIDKSFFDWCNIVHMFSIPLIGVLKHLD